VVYEHSPCRVTQGALRRPAGRRSVATQVTKMRPFGDASYLIEALGRLAYVMPVLPGKSHHRFEHRKGARVQGPETMQEGVCRLHMCVMGLCHQPHLRAPLSQFMFFGNGNWHAGIKGNHVKGRQSGINCVRFADGSTITYELPGLIVKGRACLSQPQLRAVPKPG